MAAYTLAQAITATGRSRSALLRAIRSGKLSASRDASGAYLVDTSELARVYPAGARPTRRAARIGAAISRCGSPPKRRAMQCFVETVGDLRRRLDVATEQLGEALQQVRLLTDQRTAPSTPARGSWLQWRRRALTPLIPAPAAVDPQEVARAAARRGARPHGE